MMMVTQLQLVKKEQTPNKRIIQATNTGSQKDYDTKWERDNYDTKTRKKRTPLNLSSMPSEAT